jgi:hypothetical protein
MNDKLRKGFEIGFFKRKSGVSEEQMLEANNDTFEIVSFKFEDTVSFEEQKRLMSELNKIVIKVDGFKSRDYYYSAESSRWIDSVIWTDLNLAKKGAEEVIKNPKAQETFAKIEKKTLSYSHYARIGGS